MGLSCQHKEKIIVYTCLFFERSLSPPLPPSPYLPLRLYQQNQVNLEQFAGNDVMPHGSGCSKECVGNVLQLLNAFIFTVSIVETDQSMHSGLRG